MCLLSDWERDIFEKIVCNQHFRTVNLAELPRDVRKVLSHYVGKSDQTKFSTEDESTQAVMKTMSYCLKLKEVDPPIVSAIGDMPMCVITV